MWGKKEEEDKKESMKGGIEKIEKNEEEKKEEGKGREVGATSWHQLKLFYSSQNLELLSILAIHTCIKLTNCKLNE